MSMLPNDEHLADRLAADLEALPLEGAESLAQILRGIFACLQDLNVRLAAMEQETPAQGR
ncbi:MAG: hypothetical protein EOP83_00445 [Verrucomicrobiaceae bacterium]|nr:MAG: hypothetical protein EOP83_00445 [Verrucomicrobiaceae bacterium]